MRDRAPFGLLVVSLACRDDAVDGPTLRFDLRRAELYDAPFPADDLRSDTVDLSGFPNPDAVPIVEQIRALGADLDGWSTTSAIRFGATAPIDPASLPDLVSSTGPDASVVLIDVDPSSPEWGRRFPVSVASPEDDGPFGTIHALVVLPFQGAPLRPRTRYAAVVTTAVTSGDVPLTPSATVRGLAAGETPAGATDAHAEALRGALQALAALGLPWTDVAAFALVTTQDPTAQARRFTDAARAYVPVVEDLVPTDTFDDYCVLEGTVEMPTFQRGTPPYLTEGGGWIEDPTPVLQGFETARIVLTIPRRASPEGGAPVSVFVRTGGGGDRPLVDRGVRDATGATLVPGSGPASFLASVGIVGVSVDGPHGGLRNVGGGDEQFLMFNVSNPEALRDNVRQTALELALLPDVLDGLVVAEGCGHGPVTLTIEGLSIIGHSMGATVAPLTLALEPRYRAAVLSGAGGSYIENVVWKQSPLEVAPIAELMLGYEPGTLTEHDPVLSFLQHVGESADPPPYLRGGVTAHLLVFQGVVDTYILPPMANALSASAGLDLGGAALDADHPDLSAFLPLEDALALVGRGAVALPASANVDGRTAVTVQIAEDGVEDGHEVMFQVPGAGTVYAGFLADVVAGRAPVVQAVAASR